MKKIIVLLLLAFASMCLAPSVKAAVANQVTLPLNTEATASVELMEQSEEQTVVIVVVVIIIIEQPDGGEE